MFGETNKRNGTLENINQVSTRKAYRFSRNKTTQFERPRSKKNLSQSKNIEELYFLWIKKYCQLSTNTFSSIFDKVSEDVQDHFMQCMKKCSIIDQ